jgi:Recombination directionality factor-like
MIEGTTDVGTPNRTGKIRAGKKDPNNPKKLINTPTFLLHDSPMLIPVLGEMPDEIYFTVHSDDLEAFFPTDLRWYNANELVCKSDHGRKDPATGQSMGRIAALFKNNFEPEGMTQKAHPFYRRARIRMCSPNCPDLLSENCSPHFFLEMVIPQFSMGALFTLDNTSILGLKNINSVFKMAAFRNRGRFCGEIFRLYKKKAVGHYMNKDGDRKENEVDVVDIEPIEFEVYAEKFRSKIKDVDWEALMWVRSVGFRAGNQAPALEPYDDAVLLDTTSAPASVAQIEESAVAKAKADEDALRVRANNPSVAKYFAELALLLNLENSETNRMKTAARYSDQDLIKYLQDRIKEEKRKAQAAKPAPTAAAPAPATQPAPQAAQPTPTPNNRAPLF